MTCACSEWLAVCYRPSSVPLLRACYTVGRCEGGNSTALPADECPVLATALHDHRHNSTTLMKIYLAGTITGITYDDATTWRNTAASYITTAGHDALDPMRGKEDLNLGNTPIAPSYRRHVRHNAHSIFQRDIKDIEDSDVLLVNCRGWFFGTQWELGYASALGLPQVIFNLDDNFVEHPMIAGNPLCYVCDRMSDALETLLGDNYDG